MKTKCLFTSSSNEIFLMYCLLGYCHLWQYPTKQVEATLMPYLVAWFKALLALPCWQMCWSGSPCLPIKEACFWEQSESVWEWSDEKKRERGVAAMGSSPAAICSRVCELGVEFEWMWSSSSMYILYPFSISNKMNLSRGCRRFAEPRKILC